MAGCITQEEMEKILRRFPRYSTIQTFVETGTFRGETIETMGKLFPHCHTIELSKELYETARNKYKSTPIMFHHGDSVEVLRTLIPMIRENAIFFLDAHWCGRSSGRGQKDVPLLEELMMIADRPYSDLLIIDDYRLFSTKRNEDWSEISVRSVLQLLRGKIPAWKCVIPWFAYSVMNDRMIIPL